MVITISSPRASPRTSPRKASVPELQRARTHSTIKQTLGFIASVLLLVHFWTRSGDITSYIDDLDDLYCGYIANEESMPESQSHALHLRESLSKDRYPYIPYDLMKDCGLADKCLTDSDPYILQASPVLNRSMAFIKTHKTGSSTVANMVWRWVNSRDLKRMVPRTGKNLGWPDMFPGKRWFFKGKKFDAIYNHAVYNKARFDEYLRQKGTTFTILREPMSRTISAVNYYLDRTPYNFRGFKFLLHRYENKYHKMQTYDFYTHNGMGYDLGWYEQHNVSIAYDYNSTEIQAFVDELDKSIDVVMIVERMAESLLLLREKIPGLSISELVFRSANTNGNSTHNTNSSINKVYPSKDELSKLSDIMLVDRMIYDHFNARLDREWKAKVRESPHMQRLKDGLVCLQKKVDDNFENEQIISREMNDVFSEWIL